MHHSSEPMTPSSTRLGATNQFPQGKLNASDEGEIAFRVTVRQSKVVLEFGKPVAWIGMDAEQAEALANLLLEKAKACRGDIRGSLASAARPKE